MKKSSIFNLIAFILVLIACEGKFEPKNNLDAVSLLLPENNKQCFGIKLESDKIAVDFDWNDIDQITSYTINYVDGVTGESNSLTTTDSSISIELEPGTLYTWNVTVTNDFGNSEKSEDFNFYTEGLADSNHVPFPADIEIPAVVSNSLNVSWEGVDLDNDIDYYQVFFSKENPPILLIDNTTDQSFNADVETGATYYLNIVTFDKNGNYSDSKLSVQF
tara:strand:- start:54 stop:710 length:657 start_codon:yes stop_codon:yes gene_type:complete